MLLLMVVAISVLAACGGGGGGMGSGVPSASANPPGNPGAPGSSPTPAPTATAKGIQVAQYAAPYAVNALTLGADGNIWFVPAQGSQPTVSVLHVAGGAITTYDALPSNEAGCASQYGLNELGIIAGPDANLWIAVFCGTALQNGLAGFNIVTSGGAVSADVGQYYNPPQILGSTMGSDGNVWADELTISGGQSLNNFGNGGSSSGSCNATLPSHQSEGAVTSGPDGANWLPANGLNQNNAQYATLVRVTTSCAVSMVGTTQGTSFATNTIVSAYGALWVLDVGNAQVVKFTTAGAPTAYKIPSTFGGSGYLATSSSANYVYFDDTKNGEIGRVNESTGAIQEYSLQSGGTTFQPNDLAVDAAGNVWTHSGSTILKITFPG
ncbi:MAG: hypothetical protein JO029_15075 [Candidatus Eremiobacteraeota bacterium]|nr:hypothetical protein [Candidatus Eremiobacteraeota bacterium]